MAEEHGITRAGPPGPALSGAVTLPDSLWQEIGAFCQAERIGSEAEAIQLLLREALRARAQRRRPAPRERSD